ncbi:MAG: hypothetical protein DWH91_11110 [Planctomycetota bacterium]|nr:MAG: hypothetical protein DWH91_11110 [Planctomycetota bacterium]
MNQFDSRGRRPGRPSHGGGPPRGGSSGRGHSDSGPGGRPLYRPRYQPSTQERFADARGITFEALGTFENRRAFVSDALDQLFYEREVTPQDKGLATEMSYGIARRLASIDSLLSAVCDRPRAMVQDGLWRLMRMGVYQLAWLSSIPPHAAIHETVELAHRLGQSGWAGFLNAILRRLQRDVLPVDQAGWTEQRTVAELVAHPDSAWLPLRGQLGPLSTGADSGSGQTVIEGLQLREPVFPAPDRFRSAYWADLFSYPEWMIDEWCQQLGEVGAVERASWFNSTGRMCLRVNLARTTREATLGALERMNVNAQPGRWPESVILHTPVPVSEIPGFRDGLVSIQDESAISAAALLAPQPGWKVLDLCAAPGGKTAHMAEQMRNQGLIVACDTIGQRLPLITENCQRLGISMVQTREVASDGSDLPSGPFDAALVDVPCSNTGVLGKRPEVRWRYVPGELRELMPIQSRLLKSALNRIRPGGRVVYSTCSVDSRENGELVRGVLAAMPGYELKTEYTHIPGQPVDGGYAALIVRGALSPGNA